jgi:hypothetical protein
LRRVLEARRPVESVRKEQIWKENKLRHNCQGFYRNFAKTMKTELRRATEQEYKCRRKMICFTIIYHS